VSLNACARSQADIVSDSLTWYSNFEHEESRYVQILPLPPRTLFLTVSDETAFFAESTIQTVAIEAFVPHCGGLCSSICKHQLLGTLLTQMQVEIVEKMV